jgi:catechol 2,3-dioxygenase-like lactoylglutathione lyase family enzyme
MLDRIDHLVLTVTSIDRSIAFYTAVLGLREEHFAGNRVALAGDGWKINLHQIDNDIELRALRPVPGSADLCFIASSPLAAVSEQIRATGTDIELGPVPRMGAAGPMTSIYLRDPDGNLIEISEYL